MSITKLYLVFKIFLVLYLKIDITLGIIVGTDL